MPRETIRPIIDFLRTDGHVLSGPDSLDPLVTSLLSSQVVLLGESTHGTHEFYDIRAQITKRLIQEGDRPAFIAVEADWPDCTQANRYVKGHPNAPASAPEALVNITPFGSWKLANEETVELLEWVRAYNFDHPFERRVGFYGLDMQNPLNKSCKQMLDFLKEMDPRVVADLIGTETDWFKIFPIMKDLLERRQSNYRGRDADGLFATFRNASVINTKNSLTPQPAENYNKIRDNHMFATLQHLMKLYKGEAQAIVWAHNTHVGDERHTRSQNSGYVFGQLARDAFGDAVTLVGFDTDHGSVIAVPPNDPYRMTHMRVPPSHDGSWGNVFHQSGGNRVVIFDSTIDLPVLHEIRDQRAIGLKYNSLQDRGVYVPTVLPKRYDAVVHVDTSSALHPLDKNELNRELPI